MALQSCRFLCLAVFAACLSHALAYDCPTVTDWLGTVTTQGFDCDVLQDCCLSGTDDEYCCYDYYNWSTGAIVGLAVGSIVFVAVIIGSIVACCVCCARAAAGPSHHPVHVHTVQMPQQQPGIVTVNSPPGYYAPAAPTTTKPGQYQQFHNM